MVAKCNEILINDWAFAHDECAANGGDTVEKPWRRGEEGGERWCFEEFLLFSQIAQINWILKKKKKIELRKNWKWYDFWEKSFKIKRYFYENKKVDMITKYCPIFFEKSYWSGKWLIF